MGLISLNANITKVINIKTNEELQIDKIILLPNLSDNSPNMIPPKHPENDINKQYKGV